MKVHVSGPRAPTGGMGFLLAGFRMAQPRCDQFESELVDGRDLSLPHSFLLSK